MKTEREIYEEGVKEGRFQPLHTPQDLERELREAAKNFSANHERKIEAKPLTPEQLEKNKAYFQSVLAQRPQGSLKTTRVVREQQMPLEEAKRKIWAIIQEEMIKKNETYTFNLNPNLKYVLLNLTKYFIWDISCAYDLNKGVWMTGAVGCGKTFLMNCFSRFTLENDLPTAFIMKATSEIASEVEREGVDVLQLYKQGNPSFDDLGEEADIIPKFKKDRKNVMREILFNLYSKFEKSGKTCIVTSNIFPCTREVLQKMKWGSCPVTDRYGERVQNRCLKMFNRILLKGRSHRG